MGLSEKIQNEIKIKNSSFSNKKFFLTMEKQSHSALKYRSQIQFERKVYAK